MTAKEIRTMSAGWEMDRMIAEQVFGIQPREVRIKGLKFTYPVYAPNLAIADGLWTAAELRAYGDPPQYSTRVDKAIVCLEQFTKHSWHLSKILDGYRCQVVQAPTLTQCFEAEGETVPLAICRAVLLAVAEE